MQRIAAMHALDDTTADRLLQTFVPPGTALAAGEVSSVLQLGWLVAEIDLQEDRDELGVWRSLAQRLGATTSSPAWVAPVSPLPLDDEERTARINELTAQLASRSARELAYALAYLVAVADVELGPIEQAFLDQLRRALAIDEDRAAYLVATAARIVTPSAGDGASSAAP
jgi:tellurite resistance protein